MIRDSSNYLLKNNVVNIERQLRKKARSYANVSMLSRTHGQSATPTTMGKEIANTLSRLRKNKRVNRIDKTQWKNQWSCRQLQCTSCCLSQC